MNCFTKQHEVEVRQLGFSLVNGAVDQSLAETMRDSLERIALDQERSLNEITKIDSFMVHNPMVHDDVFFRVFENESIVAALDALLGETSILYAFTTSSMPPNGTNYSNRIHTDCPRIIPGYISNVGVIVALDDFTEENGATYFLPRSFEVAEAPDEEIFFKDAVRVFPRRGDIIVFNARTWHLGGLNSTASFRHAITLNACRSYMRQRFDYPRLLGWDRAKDFNPTLRRLLGYNVRVPSSMQEYYLPPTERLYLPNQG